MNRIGPAFLLSVASIPLIAQESPNHLEPLPPMVWEMSLRALSKALVSQQRPKLWMIGDPAFGPEYSIAIIDTAEKAEIPRFVLRYSKSSIKIATPPPPPPPPGGKIEKPLPFVPAKHLKVREIPLAVELEARISAVWGRVVKETRYEPDRPFHVGLDGAFYLFYFERYYGATWLPDAEVPSLMVDLGHALIELVEADQAHRTTQEAKVVNICSTLELKLNTKPSSK